MTANLNNTLMTREEWLNECAAAILENILGPIGLDTNAETQGPIAETLKVSVGWPSTRATSANGRALGQCYSPKVSTEGFTEMFVSPYVDSALQVAGILTHELIHAAVGTDAKHGREFKRACILAGLTGPAIATVAGTELATKLEEIIAGIGAYPHARLDATAITHAATRLLKALCLHADCPSQASGSYVVRVTAKWANLGAPLCGLCEGRLTVYGLNSDSTDSQP